MKNYLLILFSLFYSISNAQSLIPLTEDSYVEIRSMRTEGNQKTRDQVIFGESKLRVGDQILLKHFYQELVDSKRNLLNIRLFTEVDIYIEKWSDDNYVDLVFFTKERWYIYPIPSVSLDGITFQEWGEQYSNDLKRLTYSLDVTHNNFTKRGDRFNLNTSIGFEKKIGFNYSLPGIDKERNWGVGINGRFSILNGASTGISNQEIESILLEEEVQRNRSIGFSISRRKDITKRHSFSVGLEETTIKQAVLNENPNYFGDFSSKQSFMSLGYQFNIEQRNLAEYATDGYNLNAQASHQGIGNNEFDLTSISAFYNRYFPLSMNKKHLGAFSLAGRHIFEKELPFFNYSELRPSNERLPRGVQNFQVLPKSYYTLKTEYKYEILDKTFYNVPLLPKPFEPVPLRVFPKVFADMGQTFSNQFVETNPLNNDFLYSFGAGIDIITLYNTPMQIELSNNHRGEIFLNLGIGTSF